MDITIVEAKDISLGTKGLAEPFAVVAFQGQHKRTNCSRCTSSPIWDCRLSFNSSDVGQSVITIDFFSSEFVSNADYLGTVKIIAHSVGDYDDSWYSIKLDTIRSVPYSISGEVRIIIHKHGKETYEELFKNIPLESVDQLKVSLSSVSQNRSELLALTSLSLPTLPKLVFSFNWLNQVDFSKNNLREFPNLMPLTNLASIDISGNLLTSIPSILKDMKSLAVLNVSNNRIGKLEPWIGQMTQLITFDISNNNLVAIPKEIGRLNHISSINLSCNFLTTIPPSIGSCFSLKSLDLSFCILKSLPEEITLLSQLTYLNLAFNKLKQLPDGIGRMHNLAKLNITENKIEDLPISFGAMKTLVSLPNGFIFDRNEFVDKNIISSISGVGITKYAFQRFMAQGGFHPGQLYYSADLGVGPTPAWLEEQNKTREEDRKKLDEISASSRQRQDAQTKLKMNALKNWGSQFIKTELMAKINYLRNQIGIFSLSIDKLMSLGYFMLPLFKPISEIKQIIVVAEVPVQKTAATATIEEQMMSSLFNCVMLLEFTVSALLASLDDDNFDNPTVVVPVIQQLNAIKQTLVG